MGGGGEAEDVLDLFAREQIKNEFRVSFCIVLRVLSKLESRVVIGYFIGKGKWVPMDHSKSEKHEGVVSFLGVRESKPMISAQAPLLRAMSRGVSPSSSLCGEGL